MRIEPKKMTPSDLLDFILEHAKGSADARRCYWVHGVNDVRDVGCSESDNFCYDCCEKKVDKILAAHPDLVDEVCLDGGWDGEHDSPPRCESCGAKLSGSLTDYGSAEEIQCLTGDCAPDFDNKEEWDALYDALSNVLKDDEGIWRAVTRIVIKARRAERKAIKKACKLAASPGMGVARIALLSAFDARMIQKAPEPSFPLWNELEMYRAIPFDQKDTSDPKIRELERRLHREAERFLALADIQIRGDCGDAPYGRYYWAFTVEIEQERLWNFPEFQAGRAYALHPCPTGNPEWSHNRDDNPYKERARHRSWDCGYTLGCSKARR